MKCFYYQLPVLLLKAQETHSTTALDARVQAPQTFAQSVARKGVSGLHELVDAICGRHGLSV